jgi:hypothetical protein
MAMEDSVQKAIRIGERNKEIIELAHNWCAHLEVRQAGGVGLVEIETGLPIGMRSFKCPYASAAGLAGMNLEVVALDFYDRNCVDCKERRPVRLPSLSSLVGERDAAQQRASQTRASFAEQQARALAARAARREALARACDPSRAGIFSLVDALDREPNDHNKQILLATAAAGAQHFDSSIQEALYDLALGGGFTRAETALEVLTAIPADPRRCSETALRVLARRDGHSVAAQTVAKYLTTNHGPLVPDALPALIELATPVSGMFSGSGSPGYPEPLIAVFRLFPAQVLAAIQDHLRSPMKHFRIQACHAISLILQVDRSFGPKVIDDLIESLPLPDDHYGEEGAAEGKVAATLADIMVNHPQEVDAKIQAGMNVGSEETRPALFEVYERMLRTEFDLDAADPPPRSIEISFQRFVHVLSNRDDNELLLKAIWFSRNQALRFPELFEKHAETLLGAAALIAGDLEAPESPLLDLSLTPDPLKSLEKQGRRQMLNTALDAVLKPIGEMAGRKPGSLGSLLLSTFEALGDGHDYFKAGLVQSLGYMGASPTTSKLVLPALYQAMTSQSVRVRAAGADAYGHIAQDNADDLPALLHETFILLLTDSYVMVHSAAVEALCKIDVPKPFVPRILAGLGVVIASYHRSRSDDRLLSDSLERFLELLTREKRPPLDPPTGKSILAIVANMKTDPAARFVADNGYYLRGIPGYGKLLVKLLSEPEVNDYLADDLVEELAYVGGPEILSIAGEFRSVASIREQAGDRLTDDFIQILTSAGAWSAAGEIASDSTNRLTNTTWDRPRKLRSQARETATALEHAAAASNPEQVIQLAESWRKIEEEMKKDDEANKTRRDPLHGLSLED